MLQEREYRPIGSDRIVRVDFRLLCATNIDLDSALRDGKLREDLYFRINTITLRVPPLRERTEDIPMLVWRFVEEFSKAFGRRIESIAKDNMETLQRYAWPGNVRELRNVVERAVIVANGPRLTIALPQGSASAARRTASTGATRAESQKRSRRLHALSAISVASVRAISGSSS